MIEPMPTLPVILDVDTGVDDACALLLAALHPALDLRAVTCVGGNAPLADVVRNTLTVLETAGRGDVPVGVGAARPLLEDPVDARHVHGADGMADLGMPAPTLAPDPRPALDLLRDTITAAADAGTPATVVPLAPMTNLALLARVYPEAFASIGRIVFMGGGVDISNATAAAEFNVFHDPEATAIVLDACASADVPVTMYGLDVFYDPLVTDTHVDGLRALGTPVADLAAGLISFHHRRFANAGATIGDAGRGRHPHRTRRRGDPATAGSGRAHRHLDPRAHRRRPPRLGRSPGARPARTGPGSGRRLPVDRDGPRIAELWVRTVRGEAS
jgi:pyrimidine-specific ribonucleoside hydrolase